MLTAPLLVSGSKAADIIQVEFDSSWDYGEDTERFIQFVRDSEIYTYELHDNKAAVPQEVLSSPGRFDFGVYIKKGENIVKTSDFCSYPVLRGTDSQAPIEIDWEQFKRNLVDQLNEQFDLELTYDSTNDEILTAVSTIEDGTRVTIFFIDLLNAQLDLELNYDDEESEIADAVADKVAEIKQGTIDFSLLQYYVRKISNDFVTNPSEEAAPAFLNYTNDIDDYMQKSTTALTDLYGGD